MKNECQLQSLMRCRLLCLIFLPFFSSHGGEVSFNREVRPILSDNCFSCHGADAANRKAGLRLDSFEGATAENDGIRAVAPGEPPKSALWTRITSGDEEALMPPPESHKQLTIAQKETLRRWIESGAKYEPHWSFVRLRQGTLPEVKHADRTRNEIDHFVLARLEAESMSLSPEASKETLIRRVTFDLTGLPPTLESVRAFLDDSSEAAYERLVDCLLQSPHYGEHLAVAWLDAARYADTNGYFGDKPRQMWLWRDWVIDALNENMPFDQFTIEQLAGDLLPGATVKQRIATGFNRNHMANNESGSIDEEFRVEYVIDRVNTTISTWMGLTAGCAQCHDHKYDPISQREFFGLFAFFNNVPEQGLIRADNPPPLLSVPSPEQERLLEECVAEAQAAASAFAPLQKRLGPEIERWEKDAPLTLPLPPDRNVFHGAFDGSLSPGAKTRGNSLVFERGVRGEAAKFDATRHVETNVSGFDPDQPWTIGLWVKPEGSLGCPLSLIEAEGNRRGLEIILQKGRVQVNRVNQWSASAIEVATTEAMSPGNWHHVVVTCDGSRQAAGMRVFVDGASMVLEIRRNNLSGTIANREPLRIGRRDSGLGFYGLIDDVRLIQEAVVEREVEEWFHGERIRGIIGVPADQRTAREEEVLRDYFIARFADAETRQAHQRVRKSISRETFVRGAIPTVLVMEEMEKPRAAFVLERGEYDKRGEAVAPHVPTAIAAWPGRAPLNRLGLAKWIVSEEHPLTARVAVNRIWAHCFGDGLVRTPDDFGSQGEIPTHPELLDFLAVEFRESGWDVKRLMKKIVMSATYRQASAFVLDGSGAEIHDPENRLLARGPGGRLSSEMLRDQALMVAGLLVPEIGGPSVKPYQPKGLWEAVSYNAEDSYVEGTGEDLWRRSLYTFIKRQAPPPSMLTFDAPTREKCTLRRSRTNTPLQALQLLNDDTYVEASRVLAERVLRQPGDEARLRQLWWRVLIREAKSEEIEVMTGLLRRQRERFAATPGAALSLLSVGASPRDTGLDAVEHAAWTIIAHSLLNLDETLSKR